MSLGTRPKRNLGGGGPPTWLIFLVGIAVVFGLYYVWIGIRNYLQTGGQGIIETTEQAVTRNTATAESLLALPSSNPILAATLTPVPPCQQFVVIVPNAIVRERPSTSAAIVTSLSEGKPVCVLGRDTNSEWYVIDSNPDTRRAEIAYMREDVIQAVNPTPTPTKTYTPLPTVTAMPTLTPTITPTFRPTPTRDPRVSDTPTPTLTPSPTLPLSSA